MNQTPMEQEFPISKYMSQKAAKLGIPISGGFELTSRCNFNCKMCYVHEMEKTEEIEKQELSVAEWLSIAGEAKKSGLLFLLLTGGEAMLRNDFIELYEKLAVMGFRLVINSNGSLLTDAIMDCFRKYPPARINISLYGASEDTYEALCENRAFENVKHGIHMLREEGISVRTVMMLNTYNVQDMEQVYEISREENTLCEMSSYLFPPIRTEKGICGKNRARLSSQEAGKYMARREKLLLGEDDFLKRVAFVEQSVEKEYRINVTEGPPIRCLAGNASFWITWNGKLRPCGLMKNPEVDVREVGFQKAWDRIREETGKIRLPVECATCNYQSICQGCAAVCQAETGRFNGKPEYFCELVKAQRDELIRLKNDIEKHRKSQ